jgi:hypothetical protein
VELVCVRCGDVAVSVVIQLGPVEASIDLCERHVADLLRGARLVADRGAVPLPRLAGPDANTRPRKARGRGAERIAP